MAWKPVMLRGTKVLARCDEGGLLSAESGRVEIRYKRDDGRAYQASIKNLKSLPDATIYEDDYCSAGSVKAPKKRPAKKKVKAAGSSKPPSQPTGDEVLVYADGACSGNPGPAGAGVVMLFDDRRLELSEYLGEGTNNIAELVAIHRALEGTPDPQRPMRIFTDSSYCIGVLSKGWKAKANKELIAKIKKTLSGLDQVAFIHVKGHAGFELNERADELAVQAVSDRATTDWQ